MTTDTDTTKLTPGAIAKLLNGELEVASEDIRDVLLDYFCASTGQHDESDSDSGTDKEAIDEPQSVTEPETKGTSSSAVVNDQPHDDPESEVPLLRNCVADVNQIARRMGFNLTECDDKAVFEKFVADGCKCNRKCCEQFTAGEILLHRLQLRELDYYGSNHVNAKNEFIVSQFAALCDTGDTTSSLQKQKSGRIRTRNTLMFHGREVCLPAFLFVNDIGIKRYKLLKKRYLSIGIQQHIHGNTEQRVRHALVYADCEQILLFIKQYSEQFGLILPGRVPGFKATDLVLLPSSLSKRELHRKYIEACTAAEVSPIGYDSFRRVWKQALPKTVIQKPRSDLCATCHKNITAISTYRCMSDDDKMEKLNCAVAHLEHVKRERQVYKDAILAARQAVSNLQFAQLGPHLPCSSDAELHISFDYAQQVHIPFDPQQPGEIYFLVPFKVGLFGIMNEAINRQVTYLIPESVVVGKGSNAVISYLDHYFDHFGLGERRIVAHADNCSGQNKNNYLMAYFMWRILTGRHQSVKFCFLPPGHTKFSPDWAFGMMKRKLRHTKVCSLSELKQCFEASSPVSAVNVACLTGSEDGQVFVPVRDWSSFLIEKLKYRSVEGIKSFHYFHFHADHPGQIGVQEHSGAPVTPVQITSVSVLSDERPVEIVPHGLPHDRKSYLFDKIRQFCSSETKDILCPKPPETTFPILATSSGAPNVTESAVEAIDDEMESLPPAKRRKPICSYCKMEGHRNSVKRDGTFWCLQRQS